MNGRTQPSYSRTSQFPLSTFTQENNKNSGNKKKNDFTQSHKKYIDKKHISVAFMTMHYGSDGPVDDCQLLAQHIP